MTDGLWPHQQAVYTRLTGSSPAIAGGRIYDVAPDNATYPFVEFDATFSSPTDADTVKGSEEFLTLHVWDRPGDGESGHIGQKRVKEIMGLIRTELHKKFITVTGRDARIWVRDEIMARDQDSRTVQGIMRLKLSSYEAE